MKRLTGCSVCGLKLSQIEQIYQRRLNSLADTFLTLLNNFQNNNLFIDLQKIQIIENRNRFQLEQLKQKVYSFRMEFLQNVMQGIISQNQQNTIKKLQMQNAYLKNQNNYFHKLIEYHQLSSINFEPNFLHSNQIFNQEPMCQSEYDEEQDFVRSSDHHYRQTGQNFSKDNHRDHLKQVHKSKLYFKIQSEQIDCSSDSQKAYQSPSSTSFAVNLKQNGHQDLSNNCISSIDPVSDVSSFPSSQKRSTKTKQKFTEKAENQIFTVSLRQQLSSLNSNSKRVQMQPYSESRRKKQIKKNIQNEQNIQPIEYQFKYLKF